MRLSRRVGVLATSFAIVTSGIVMATPAFAADASPACTVAGNTFIPLTASPGQTLTFAVQSGCTKVSAPTLSGTLTANIYNGSSYSSTSWTSDHTGIDGVQSPSTVTLVVGSGSSTVIFRSSDFANVVYLNITAGSGGVTPGSGDDVVPAPTYTLSIATSGNGATCKGGSPSGVSGSWVATPSAADCKPTSTTVNADAKLLGWSTSAAFPVGRAQAQIDKHWGVIDEAIDGSRMIFIPAGMSTLVSGSNTLFPIWSALP